MSYMEEDLGHTQNSLGLAKLWKVWASPIGCRPVTWPWINSRMDGKTVHLNLLGFQTPTYQTYSEF